jgi:hypothetical protein
MVAYDDKFPLGLNDEEKSALIWKIEQDYRQSDQVVLPYKNEYITFAVNFYTRNAYSLECVVEQHRAHKIAEQRRNLSEAFMADMKRKLRAYELAHN